MKPYELTMTRTFRAQREKVWQAWTTEEGLAQWWWNTWPDTIYRMDARVGGSYRIDAGDHGIGVRGEFLEIEPYHRLALSWIWIEDGADGELEQVTLTFTPDGDGTRVDLLHTGPWTSAKPADNYRLGWDFVLEALDHALVSPPAQPV